MDGRGASLLQRILEDPGCRHDGGIADCPPACWLLYGERFVRESSDDESRGE